MGEPEGKPGPWAMDRLIGWAGGVFIIVTLLAAVVIMVVGTTLVVRGLLARGPS